MDFTPTEEEELAVEAFRRYAAAEVGPLADAYREKFIPKDVMAPVLQGLVPYGLCGGFVAEELGGMDLSPITVGLLFEELARVSPDVAVVSLLQLECGPILAASEPEIRQRYLGPLLRGEKFGSIGISEPDVGSNIAEIRCQAKADGADYVISGEKQWISNGHYSDFNICVARVADDPNQGLSLFLIDREHGYTSQNIPKIALNSQSTAQLFFDNVRVPKSHMLVPAGAGMRRLLVTLEASRPLVGLLAIGIGQAALDESVKYASERKQHGKPIAQHQLIQARIAEMATQLDAARLLVYRALDRVARGERSEVQSAMAKLFASEAVCDITRHAIAIHGGNGLTPEYRVEQFYRLAPILTMTEGTPEMQKLIIGRGILGESAF